MFAPLNLRFLVLSRKRNHGPYASVVELRPEDAIEFGERELARTVAGRGALELPLVPKAGDHAAHFRVRNVHEVEAAERFCQLNTVEKVDMWARTVTDVRRFRLDRRLQADQFAPLRESTTHNLTVVHCSQ